MKNRQLTAFVLGILLALIVGRIYVVQSHLTVDSFPATAPTLNSAPPGAIAVCTGKEVGDGCNFTLNTIEIEGICFNSGDILACGPELPAI